MPTNAPRERLLSVPEIAEAMKVNHETVRRWLRTGELKGIQLGSKAGWRIRESDFQAFLRARENALPGQPRQGGQS